MWSFVLLLYAFSCICVSTEKKAASLPLILSFTIFSLHPPNFRLLTLSMHTRKILESYLDYILHININLWPHYQHHLWWKLVTVPKGIHIHFRDITVSCTYRACMHVTVFLLCFTFCHPTVYGYIALSLVFSETLSFCDL